MSSIVKREYRHGGSGSDKRNATFLVDGAIEITVYYDRYVDKNVVSAHFEHAVDNVTESTFHIVHDRKEQTTRWTWSCFIERYIVAALRVAKHIGFDIEHAEEDKKAKKRATLADVIRMRVISAFLLGRKAKKASSLTFSSSFSSSSFSSSPSPSFAAVGGSKESENQLEQDLASLRALNPRYADALDAASLVEARQKQGYSEPWLIFCVPYDRKTYEVIVIPSRIDTQKTAERNSAGGGGGKGDEEGKDDGERSSGGRPMAAVLYVRAFGETELRPKCCLEVQYSYDRLWLATFYGSKEEDAVCSVVLEKFGRLFNFGALEQNSPAPYSLSEHCQYLWTEGTLPKSREEEIFDRKKKEQQEKDERDARKQAREEKKRAARAASESASVTTTTPAETLGKSSEKEEEEEMSEQEKADIIAEKAYCNRKSAQERQKAAWQAILESALENS